MEVKVLVGRWTEARRASRARDRDSLPLTRPALEHRRVGHPLHSKPPASKSSPRAMYSSGVSEKSRMVSDVSAQGRQAPLPDLTSRD